MKKIFISVLLLLFSPAFAIEITDNTEDMSQKIRKTSAVRPKREHMETMKQTQKSLNKNKEKFKQRKEIELDLLRYEYKVLEYST